MIYIISYNMFFYKIIFPDKNNIITISLGFYKNMRYSRYFIFLIT
jgi:hypothetical protein